MHVDTIVICIEGKNADGDWAPVPMTRARTVADRDPYMLTDFPVSFDFSSIYERHIRKHLTKGSILNQAKQALASVGAAGFVWNLHFDFSGYSDLRIYELPRSDFERSVIEKEGQPVMNPQEFESLLEHGE